MTDQPTTTERVLRILEHPDGPKPFGEHQTSLPYSHYGSKTIDTAMIHAVLWACVEWLVHRGYTIEGITDPAEDDKVVLLSVWKHPSESNGAVDAILPEAVLAAVESEVGIA